MSNRFSQIPEGSKFQFAGSTDILTKVGKNLASRNDGTYRSQIHGNRAVVLVEDEVEWRKLKTHTFEFTETQLAGVIEAIIERATSTYGAERIDADRLRKGLYCAHRTKPIRLIALLDACPVDFPKDVIYGVYRHYDPATDTMRNGWVAQHSYPHEPSIWDLLFGDDEDDEE